MKRQVFVITTFLLFSVVIAKGQIAQNSVIGTGPFKADSLPSFADLEDLIHLGDLIEIDVVGSTDLDWRGEITPEGFLTGLNFSGDPVFALCKSGNEVANAIRALYSKFLDNPEVRVSILDRSNRPMAVLLGAVRLPQRFRLLKGVSLRQLIVMSGGFSENTSGDIQIFRQPSVACTGFASSKAVSADVAESETESGTLTVSIQDILSGDTDSDPVIYYGDLIRVIQALPVYVIGDVSNPGSQPYSKELTIQRAIDAAGGILKDSKGLELRVFRRNPTGTEIIKPNPENFDSPSVSDFKLREYDIVEVFGGRTKRAEYPPVIRNPEFGTTSVDTLPIRIVN